jgi:hypothetical protein
MKIYVKPDQARSTWQENHPFALLATHFSVRVHVRFGFTCSGDRCLSANLNTNREAAFGGVQGGPSGVDGREQRSVNDTLATLYK